MTGSKFQIDDIWVYAGSLLVLGAFTISLFFSGYQDTHYAPASLFLLIFACMAILPSIGGKLHIPSATSAMILFTSWVYVTLSLSWSTVPFASLVTYLIFLAFPLCFFAPLLTTNPERWIKPLGVGLMLALTILAGWALLQFR